MYRCFLVIIYTKCISIAISEEYKFFTFILHIEAPINSLAKLGASIPLSKGVSEACNASFRRGIKKTTIFISHRLGSTKLADEILVIDGGKIIERGSHNELMAKAGQYFEMFEAQRSWYI